MKHGSNEEVEQIPHIASFFDIGLPGEIAAITDGIGNHNYFVNTLRGEYVVKFLVTQAPIGVENDVAIEKQLGLVGIKTPAYLQNRFGQYVYSSNGMNAVVAQKIIGSTPRFASRRLAYAIGAVLAQFHTSVTELPHPHKGWMHPDVLGIYSEETTQLCSKLLPQGITHGDMHIGNVIVSAERPDDVYAILDFEEVGDDAFVVDLARSILGVCYSENEDFLTSALVEAEIHGYESVRKLNEDEKRLLPQAVRYAADACIKWFREHGYERYVERHRKRADSFGSLRS